MRYRVKNLTRNTLLADAMEEADTFYSRFKGLMGVTELPAGRALHIRPCASIHTFFMRIAIDVLFLDAERRVVEVLPALPPWRMSRYYPSAVSVLELPPGCAQAAGTLPGDQLVFEPV